jgi:hypothetical protein
VTNPTNRNPSFCSECKYVLSYGDFNKIVEEANRINKKVQLLLLT